MPYIKQFDRNGIVTTTENGDPAIDIKEIDNAGELQYVIAVMIKDFMLRKGLKYQNCNDVMGALTGAQLEFYRRTVAPYEDLKINENGDI